MPPKRKRKGAARTPAKPKPKAIPKPKRHTIVSTNGSEFTIVQYLNLPVPFPVADRRTYQAVGDGVPRGNDAFLTLRVSSDKFRLLLDGLQTRAAATPGPGDEQGASDSLGVKVDGDSVGQEGVSFTQDDSAVDVTTPADGSVAQSCISQEVELSSGAVGDECSGLVAPHNAATARETQRRDSVPDTRDPLVNQETDSESRVSTGTADSGIALHRSPEVSQYHHHEGVSAISPAAPPYSPITPQDSAFDSYSEVENERKVEPTQVRKTSFVRSSSVPEVKVEPPVDSARVPEPDQAFNQVRGSEFIEAQASGQVQKLAGYSALPLTAHNSFISLSVTLPNGIPQELPLDYPYSPPVTDQRPRVPPFITLKYKKPEVFTRRSQSRSCSPAHTRTNNRGVRARDSISTATSPIRRTLRSQSVIETIVPPPIMAPVKDPNDVSTVIKDVLDNLYDVQTKTHGYIPETQDLLVERLADLTGSLSQLRDLTDRQVTPNNPVHDQRIPPEIVDYVDEGRNPDIFTRDFVENVTRGNSVINGKKQAFRDFSVIFAAKLKEGFSGMDQHVDQVMERAGLDKQLEAAMKNGSSSVTRNQGTQLVQENGEKK